MGDLENICFPGSTPYEHNCNMRAMLEAAEPLIQRGTSQTIKNQVTRALQTPLDDSHECASAHFWALQELWTYIHWDRTDEPAPPQRQRMIELWKELRGAGIYPGRRKNSSFRAGI